jgi:hypothetical protein
MRPTQSRCYRSKVLMLVFLLVHFITMLYPAVLLSRIYSYTQSFTYSNLPLIYRVTGGGDSVSQANVRQQYATLAALVITNAEAITTLDGSSGLSFLSHHMAVSEVALQELQRTALHMQQTKLVQAELLAIIEAKMVALANALVAIRRRLDDSRNVVTPSTSTAIVAIGKQQGEYERALQAFGSLQASTSISEVDAARPAIKGFHEFNLTTIRFVHTLCILYLTVYSIYIYIYIRAFFLFFFFFFSITKPYMVFNFN